MGTYTLHKNTANSHIIGKFSCGLYSTLTKRNACVEQTFLVLQFSPVEAITTRRQANTEGNDLRSCIVLELIETSSLGTRIDFEDVI